MRTSGIAWKLPASAVELGLIALISAGQALSPGEVRISSRPYTPASQALRIESRLVQVEVVVRDVRGRPISGLKKDNFAVLESGHPRDISEFLVETSPELSLSPAKPKSPPPASAPPTQPAPVQAGTPEAAPYVPRWIVLFFDDINTLPGDLAHAKIAARRFIKEAGIGGDRIAVFTSSGGQILDFTHASDAVLEATAKVEPHPRKSPGGLLPCPRMTAYEAYEIVGNNQETLRAKVEEACHCSGAQACDVSQIVPGQMLTPNLRAAEDPDGGSGAMRDAIVSVLEQAQGTWAQARLASQATLDSVRGSLGRLAQMPGKRILMLASAGFLSGDLDEEKDAIIDEALHDSIVINSLDAKGLYSESPETPLNETVQTSDLEHQVLSDVYEIQSLGDRLDSEDAAMARFAESTGGLLFRNNNDLDYGFRELGLAPAYSYELGFVPDEDGKYHKIKVELKNGSHDFIQARPGYFAPTKEAGGPTAAERLDAEVKGSDERSDFPATVSGALGPMKSGAREITVQAHVDIAKLPFEKQKDRHDEKLTFVAGLFDSQGKFVVGKEAEMDLALTPDSFERFSKTGITGTMSLEAPPGKYRLRVVVEEAVKGDMTATTQNVQIQ